MSGGSTSLTASYVYGNYIDEVLTLRRGSLQDYYYHADDQHNVVKLTDSNGDVVEAYDYGDYGLPEFYDATGTLSTANTSAVGNPYLFTGRRWDAELGYYYYRNRYMDPVLGRFVSRDPIGLWGDAANLGNGYTYAASNPWSLVDPFGLAAGGNQGSRFNQFMTGLALLWYENAMTILELDKMRLDPDYAAENYVAAETEVKEVSFAIKEDPLGAMVVVSDGVEEYVQNFGWLEAGRDGPQMVMSVKGGVKTLKGVGGLITEGLERRARKGALSQAKRDLNIQRSQHPDTVVGDDGKPRQYRRVELTDRNGNRTLDGNGQPIYAREYQYTRPDESKIIIQDHSNGHTFHEGGIGDQGPHFNVRPPNNTRNGSVSGTEPHYEYDK